MTFICLALGAPLVTTLPSLSLRVSGPENIEGIENLKLVATITNTCNQTMKLLNVPGSPLSKAPAEIFWVRDVAGNKPLFTGIRVIEYVPSMVSHLKEEHFFTTLAPGEFVDVEHDRTSLQHSKCDHLT